MLGGISMDARWSLGMDVVSRRVSYGSLNEHHLSFVASLNIIPHYIYHLHALALQDFMGLSLPQQTRFIQACYQQLVGQTRPLCKGRMAQRLHTPAWGSSAHVTKFIDTICRDSLRSILVCLYNLMSVQHSI